MEMSIARFASDDFTTRSNDVEAVCNATTNIVEDGVAHLYTVNPCGVAIGRDAYFRIELAPADYPDDEIVWSNTVPAVAEFVEGRNTGRAVTVHGLAEGETTLEVHIGDSRSNPPKFTLRVVPIATVNLRAWIIESKTMETAFSADDIRRMVKDANDVYAQVGVTLNLIEPIVITNIPDAYDAQYNPSTNQTSRWTFWDIVDIATNTCGLECYFINSFADSSKTIAANSEWGLVATKRADGVDLAHEIGHALGLRDVYISNQDDKASSDPLLEIAAYEKPSASNLSGDWNGGCYGKGTAGTRYYRSGLSMQEVVSRMLMNGVRGSDDCPRDITNGDVRGVYYTRDADMRKVWSKGDVNVAFPWSNRNPTHK